MRGLSWPRTDYRSISRKKCKVVGKKGEAGASNPAKAIEDSQQTKIKEKTLMTKSTKILLVIVLTGFALGCTGLFWCFGTPVGAIFFGLFLNSRLLEKEVAFFDKEEQERLDRAEKVLAAEQNHSQSTAKLETLRPALASAARAF